MNTKVYIVPAGDANFWYQPPAGYIIPAGVCYTWSRYYTPMFTVR